MRWSGGSERDVARLAVLLASEQDDATKRQGSLVSRDRGGGFREFEKRAGARLLLNVQIYSVNLSQRCLALFCFALSR